MIERIRRVAAIGCLAVLGVAGCSGTTGGDGNGSGEFTGPPTDASYVEVAVSLHHSCALTDTGHVECWGNNETGQLGNGASGEDKESAIPVAVRGIDSAVEVSIGKYYGCARLGDGELRCWGSNYGQLGNGETGDESSRPTPVAVEGITTAVSLSAGSDQACAVLESGSVRCWGENDSGELGNGNLPSGASSPNQPSPVPVEGIETAESVAVGTHHACAILEDGSVRCWGENKSGQLGNGEQGHEASRATPVEVRGLDSVADVAAGNRHNCALLEDRGLRCWGDNFYGGLGTGDREARTEPTEVTGLESVVSVAAGLGHTCAVLDGGRIQCWGHAEQGRLGNGETESVTSETPVSVEGIDSATSVAVNNHSCGVLDDGSINCWGTDDREQLGDGADEDEYSSTPVEVRDD